MSVSWALLCRDAYRKLIGPLRKTARENGYALAVHGSLARDIDLIAVPWQPQVSHPMVLIEDLLKVVRSIPITDTRAEGIGFFKPEESSAYFQAGMPGAKPHGRLVWSIHLGGGPYLDISVMPPRGLYGD